VARPDADTNLAARLMQAAVETATSRPVTVKDAAGLVTPAAMHRTLPARAEDLDVKAITVHGRTRRQFTTDRYRLALAGGRRQAAVGLPVINGDILTADDARPCAVRRRCLMLQVAASTGVAGSAHGAGVGGTVQFWSSRTATHCHRDRASAGVGGLLCTPLGLKMFRKHHRLVRRTGPWPADPLERRASWARTVWRQMKWNWAITELWSNVAFPATRLLI
jgi:hypothetical protein